MGLLQAPSTFKNMLGEFPVSGLERSTDFKLRRRPSWVLHGGWTQLLRGAGYTRYPRWLISWALGKHGWHLAFKKACIRLMFGSLNCGGVPSFKWKGDETWRYVKSGNFCQPGSEAQNKPFCVARDFFHNSTVNTKLASTASLLIQI